MTEWASQIAAITLFVEDKDRSLAFYRKVFELKPEFEDASDAAVKLGGTFVFLTSSARAPEMIAPVAAGAPGNGPRQVYAIIVADVDAVCDELIGKGVALINGPADRPWGMRTANFSDPDGNVWEIAQEIAREA